MAHLALYREWRPQTFTDLVGQQHVVRTLRNALTQGRFAHAYLLAGPRGTGKTTVARLIAKALNCQAPKDGEPCNQCAACQNINRGQSMDIIEIDAASNRGIDDIRSLRDNVKFAPTELKYKVYIIDEVHMLTEPAFNALLKTLEEPPGHVAFVLATTEAHKIPVTIASRCQRYDFHRLTTREIIGRLQAVCEKYGVSVAPEALAAIARQAEGGMRDALSLLDQVMAYADPGQAIGLDDALIVLGAVPLDQFVALDEAIVGESAGTALLLLDEVSRQGKDLRQFIRDYLGHLRDLLLVQVVADPAQLVDVPETALAALKVQAGRVSRHNLLESIRQLAALESELKFAASPRLLVEIALIRLCAAPGVVEAAPEVAVAAERPRPAVRAPRAPASPPVSPPGSAPSPPPTAPAGAAAAPTQEPAEPSPPAPGGTVDLAGVQQAWPRVLELLTRKYKSTHALLRDAKPVDLRGHKLFLQFEYPALGEMVMSKSNHKDTLEKALAYLGLPDLQIQLAQATTSGGAAPAPIEGAAGARGTLTARLLNALGGELETKGDQHQ